MSVHSWGLVYFIVCSKTRRSWIFLRMKLFDFFFFLAILDLIYIAATFWECFSTDKVSEGCFLQLSFEVSVFCGLQHEHTSCWSSLSMISHMLLLFLMLFFTVLMNAPAVCSLTRNLLVQLNLDIFYKRYMLSMWK